jgi:hypothetical protein
MALFRRAAHIRMMAKTPAYSFKIEPHTIHPERYRWTIFENGLPLKFSGIDHATRDEASAEAERQMQSLLDLWQIGR